ncbi:MAG: hypothetical protein ACOC38_03940 [Promethearchaeia archaeon]
MGMDPSAMDAPMFSSYCFFISIPVASGRWLVVYLLYLYYQSELGGLKVVIAGIFSELQPFLMYLSYIIFPHYLAGGTVWIIPVPVFLPLVLMAMKALPDSPISVPWEESDSEV